MLQMKDNVKETESAQAPRLKREIGLISAVNLILNLIIGTGIFITPGTVLLQAGSVGMCLLIWVSSGLISILGALVFAELSIVIPKSGGIYTFLMAAFKHSHPFFGPLLGYNFILIQLFMVIPASLAIVAMLFSDHIYQTVKPSFSDDFNRNYENVIENVLAVFAILAIGIVNYSSVKLFVLVQNLLSFFKVFGCMFIISGGAYMWCSGKALDIPMGFSFSDSDVSVKALIMSFYGCLYSYDGWCFISGVTEEVKNPNKNILLSVLIGVPITTCLFVLINIAYLTALTVTEVTTESAVAVTFGARVFGQGKLLITFCVALSALGTGFGMTFYASRLCYAAAIEGHMLKVFCYLHKTRLTPAPAILMQVVLGLFFYVFGRNIMTLVNFYNFLNWIFYGLTMCTLFAFRRKMPDADRPFKVPLLVPATVTIIAALLAIIPIVVEPSIDFILAVLFIMLGSVVYYPLIYRKVRIPGVEQFSQFLETHLDIIPPAFDYEEEVKC